MSCRSSHRRASNMAVQIVANLLDNVGNFVQSLCNSWRQSRYYTVQTVVRGLRHREALLWFLL